MDRAEFDQFAREYRQLHQQNIRHFRESPEYFAEYKIVDTAAVARRRLGERELDLLDFGTGVGNAVPYLAEHLPRARLTCLDISEESVAIARERFPGMAQYCTFDGGQLPFPDASFDLLYTACVFHHIPHAEHPALLREFHRVLRPGGALVIFEHNPYNPLTQRAVSTCPFDENAQLIRPGAMTEQIADAGFAGVERKYRIFFPGFVRWLRCLEPYLAWLPLGGQYYVAATRPG